MLLHHLPLLVVERARLVEDALGDPDLADVVQEGADLDRVELDAAVAEAACERDGDAGDALGVAAGVVVLRLHRAGERPDRLDVLLAHLLDEAGALDRRRKLRRIASRSRSQRSASKPAWSPRWMAAMRLPPGTSPMPRVGLVERDRRRRADDALGALPPRSRQRAAVVRAGREAAGELEQRLQVVVALCRAPCSRASARRSPRAPPRPTCECE